MLPSKLTIARVIEPIGLMSMGYLLQQRGGARVAAAYSTKSKRPAAPPDNAKIKQASMVKALYKQNKEIFGKLLESKKDRLKKEKLTKRAAASASAENIIQEQVLFSQHDQGPGITTKGVATRIRTSISVQDRSTNIITKAGEAVRGHEQSEVNWMIKNFPARARVLNRANPEKIKYAFDEISTASSMPPGQFEVFVKKPVSQMIEGETRKSDLASVRQFITSLQDCQDIGESGDFKLIRVGNQESAEAVETDPDLAESLINGNEVEAEEWNLKAVNPAEAIDPLPSTINTSSQAHSELSSAGYILFPYDNPQRVVDSGQSFKEILSLPFPRGTPESANVRLPSVSKILNVTMPPEQVEVLKKWEQKMIAQMGEDGFKEYKEALFRNGKELHANLESLLRGTPMDEILISEPITGHWRSLANIVTQIQDVHVLESHVTHPELGYCGIVDCVATYKDKLVVIDWKTSEKPKPFVSMTYDTPLQIAAYIGAINYDPNYSLKITQGLIVVAYQSGQIGQIFHLNPTDVGKYWKMWVRRLKLFQSQQGKNLE